LNSSLSTVVLRGYQNRTLDVLREKFREGKRRVVLYAPTGSGKTEMGMEMVRGAIAKAVSALFVANRVELVGQAWRRFFKSGITAGVIQAENTRGVDQSVIIASIQTIARRGWPRFKLLIIDEAHTVAGSKDYERLLVENPDVFVIGLTATPFAKGMARKVQGLGPIFEDIARATTIRELIDDGYLVDVDIYGPSEPDLAGVKIVAGEYHQGQLEEAVDRPPLIGDIVTHWMRLAKDRQTVVFATSIAHSQHIVEQFHAVGVRAEHIDAYTNDEDRRAILQRFASGATRVLSNCSVLAEGWDCPSCEVMILARPTKSLIRYIQMSGRVLRPVYAAGFDLATREGRLAAIAASGKARALILDHSGTAKRLGFPTDDLPLELDDGTRTMAEKKAREERAALPHPCPGCAYLMPAKVRSCPACGFRPKRPLHVDEQDGELVQMDRKNKIKTADKEIVFAELLGYAIERGFKPGWAYHKCVELYGAAPRKRLDPIEPTEKTRKLIRHLAIKHAKSKEQSGEKTQGDILKAA
jgi:DNA repair protein RadD